MATTGKILTINANHISIPADHYGSKDEYQCANAQITMGLTGAPSSLNDCFERFPGVKSIAEAIGVTVQNNLFSFPGNCFGTRPFAAPYDLYLGMTGASDECLKIKQHPDLGEDFYGCLWGLPEAPYNCSCPDLGKKFEAYIKLRLNAATFWNTPKDAPVKRREFLDSLKYSRKFTINVAGDLNLRPGNIAEIRTNAISGYPYDINSSVLNGVYWIISVKHVITNSGTHETSLVLSDILKPNTTSSTSTNGGGGPNDIGQWNGGFDLPNNPGDYYDPFYPPPNFGGHWS